MSLSVQIKALIANPTKYANKIKLTELEELIIILKEYYYNQDQALVPDLIFDKTEDVLRQRKPGSYALFLIGAPSQGADVKLPYPMASQNKLKAGDGTTDKWLAKNPGDKVISHKLDGISLLFNKTGDQIQLLTRGNGLKGSDVSNLYRYLDFSTFKGGLDLSDRNIVVRGEVIMTKKNWDDKYQDQYPNVRNFVSGAVNRAKKSPKPEDLQYIRFVAYQVLEPKMKPSEQFAYLQAHGFHVTPHQTITGTAIKKLSEKSMKLRLGIARKNGIYQIDGLIINLDQYVNVTNKNPKNSIAFKSQTDEIAQTKVIRVEWRGSKRSILFPRVIIEPVFLSGGTLSVASGHNAKYIHDNQIGPGAIVSIVRSGEVIPFITEVIMPADEPDMPDDEYEWISGDKDNNFVENHIRLTKKNDQVYLSILSHAAKTLEIDHLGPGTLKKLVAMSYHEITDLLNITQEELYEVPSLGKNADKIWHSIQKLTNQGVKMSQLMDASNVFATGLGTRIMQLVLDDIPDLLEFPIKTKTDKNNLLKLLIDIKGVELKTAEKIWTGLPKFKKFLKAVPQIRIIDDEDEDLSDQISNDDLAGMRVIFTGIRNKELEKIIIASGGTLANGVSKTHTNQVVVAKDPDANSNKLNTARTLGVKIYGLDEFIITFDLD